MSIDSDIELNAFVDGELSPEQHAEMLAAMERDPELAAAANRLANLKASVRLAYPEAAGAPGRYAPHAWTPWRALAAALAMLVIGMSGGWLLHEQFAGPERFVLLDADGRANAPATVDSLEVRIVFHVENPDQALAGDLLDDVEGMLLLYREQQRPLRIEIVAHGEGLAMLRNRLSNHKARIARLAALYENLSFVACQNTIDRLRVERGIEVKLVPAVGITRSGVGHVVERQKQGWAYIKA